MLGKLPHTRNFSVQRKMAIVARLLRGEPLELVARETNVSIARLTEWREMAAGSNSLHVPAARRRRIGRRLVGIRALKADPTGAGQCCPTLLIAREIAGHWSNHPIPKMSCAPLIIGRRMRRCCLHFPEQRGKDQQKRKNWQAHRSPGAP